MKALSAAFGVVMVLMAGLDAGPVALGVLAAALGAVVGGLFDQRAAVLAVLLTVVGLALGAPTPVSAAVSGLAATVYVLTGYADRTGANTLTVPSMVGLFGFTLAGLAATAITAKVTWVPLLAPIVMTAALILVAIPLVGSTRTRPAGDDDATD